MFLIVGLGNIGEKYKNTRHNVGFKFIEKLNISINKSNSTSDYGLGFINNKKVILCKPKTYMNLSGDAVIELMNYYKVNVNNIIIIYDDISLDIGNIRIREKGSHGGHNGIKHIINKLNTNVFNRIRIGIGENKNIDLSTYVLSDFTNGEIELLYNRFKDVEEAINIIVSGNIKQAMNIFN